MNGPLPNLFFSQSRYLDFVEMDDKVKFDVRDASFLSSDCPLKVYPVPE